MDAQGLKELKASVEQIAAEQNKTPVEVISEIQSAAARFDNEVLLDALCKIKWDYIPS